MKYSFLKTKRAFPIALLSALFLLESCGTEEEVFTSVDWATQSHKGSSYPSASLDDGTYFFNLFLDFLFDCSDFGYDGIDEKTQPHHLKFSAGPEFIGKGYANKFAGGKDKANLNYLEIPITAFYQHFFASGGTAFAGAGPYLSYGLFGKIKTGTTSGKVFDDQHFKRFDAGLNISGGFKLPTGLVFRLVYDYGLANIAQISNGDKTRNRSVSLNVGYDLDKLLRMKKTNKAN